MDLILKVFSSLGVDQTFFPLFIVVGVVFIALKTLLFGKLQMVLEERENKTTKLEEKANEKFKSAEGVASKYATKIETANQEAYSLLSQRKAEIEKRESEKIKTAELELEEKVAGARKKAATELDVKKKEIMQNADNLASELVNKLVN